MNFDIPYEKLGIGTKVDYIPLKLALNDITDENVSYESEKKLLTNYNNYENDFEKSNSVNILFIGLVSLVCVMLLLYAIYYFVILRRNIIYTDHNQPKIIYNQVG
ncbi:ac78-like protein [Cryptophlebia peltastica nucleopolyhedrovirus]|uniref:Ac78-like protein n=1 Tax=Cryptophlebia peltastica nucleopolyhedrovirus TaxID=2304025 RepID=A0A346RNT1_9ABAC|nr:ac78-like protein [Cryptophlebia peltastica nucleopolyhedrovirus]AXS67728.1 ac78-like protein [Cryptophlebia peltastica nucleopolyhedrovirus]